MKLFFSLLTKILPLYLLIILGVVASKKLQAQKETIARIVIYLVAPVIVFQGVVTSQLGIATLFLPLIFLLVSSIVCGLFFWIGKFFWQDATKNLLAFAAASGNTGYFGLPVILALFGPAALTPAVLCTLGMILFENTLGFYITARGHHTVKEAAIKVAKLPAVYAFILAVILNLGGWHLTGALADLATSFRGAYTVLGMMLVGLAIASGEKLVFDKLFTAFTFISKFIVWPALLGALIFLDSRFFHFFPAQNYPIMMVLSVVPMAANTVAYAAELKAYPEKAALAVLLSTIFALFYIPCFIALLIKN